MGSYKKVEPKTKVDQNKKKNLIQIQRSIFKHSQSLFSFTLIVGRHTVHKQFGPYL